MNHAEKADTLAALPGEPNKGRRGRKMDTLPIFDRKHWTGFDGCLLLILLNKNFSQIQKDFLNSELSKHSKKTKKSSISFNKASVKEGIHSDKKTDNYCIIFEFWKICTIYETYFDLEEPITPRHFISWAKERDSFTVPDVMLEWYKRKK